MMWTNESNGKEETVFLSIEQSNNKIMKSKVIIKPYSINIPNCPNGMYLIQVIDEQGVILKTEKKENE